MLLKKIAYSLAGITAILMLVSLSFIMKPQLKNEQEMFLKNDNDLISSIKNLPIKVDGEEIYLKNGSSETLIPGSASKTVIRFFGEPVFNGQNEAFFLLTKDGSGSGTFFFAAAAEKINGNWKASNTIFLGDRIAPQNINIFSGVANFNFAERKSGDSFAVPPSIGKTMKFQLKNGQLIEVK